MALKMLPPDFDANSPSILKKAGLAHRYLGELKGVCKTIPNEGILLNTLSLQEAKESSSIENIVTTHDELFRENLVLGSSKNPAAKEVQNYSSALKKGFEVVRTEKLIRTECIKNIQKELEQNKAGFRRVPGTKLENPQTGEVVYEPPQSLKEIKSLMANLVQFINDEDFFDADPLVKMAIMHFQFESIHPFYDGNGRTGRILNVLYLVQQGLLDLPVLYLSRGIIRTKSDYYRLLQKVREDNAWEEWVVYILTLVAEISKETIQIVNDIAEAMMHYKHYIRDHFGFYSQDLIHHLFFHPYTKIGFLKDALKVSRQTASTYLRELASTPLMQEKKIGREKYFVNVALVKVLSP